MAANDRDTVYDVAVVGAGPAGAATARWLARRGLGVVVLERSRFERPRIGESLAPGVQEWLRGLGLWDEFLALEPLPSWGTRSVWGDAEPRSHAHLFSPYGCGWHVDRRRFDRMLARGAAAAGADLLEGLAVRRCDWRDGCWSLECRADAAPPAAAARQLRARALVDATGRGARVARSLGARYLRFDRLVGVAVQWNGIDAADQGHLLVEAAGHGWWYSAPLPSAAPDGVGEMVAMLMTDADLCARFELGRADSWHACLQQSEATRRRLASAQPSAPPRVHGAHSQRQLVPDGIADGRPWLAVGDAGLAVDPVSGSGVLRALRSAAAAADALERMLRDPGKVAAARRDYETGRDRECTAYLQERIEYYRAEGRYQTPFWARRRPLAAAAV